MTENVQFDQESIPSVSVRQKTSGLAGFLIRTGIAKNQQEANVVMLFIVVICMVIMAIAIYFLMSSPSSSLPPQPDPDSLLPEKMRNR